MGLYVAMNGQHACRVPGDGEWGVGVWQSLYEEGNRDILRAARVVGMTTTGAAMHQQLLSGMGSRIALVEEAGEVLEAHILASLSHTHQQLILIGDHYQLRPKTQASTCALTPPSCPPCHSCQLKHGLGQYLVDAGWSRWWNCASSSRSATNATLGRQSRRTAPTADAQCPLHGR